MPVHLVFAVFGKSSVYDFPVSFSQSRLFSSWISKDVWAEIVICSGVGE